VPVPLQNGGRCSQIPREEAGNIRCRTGEGLKMQLTEGSRAVRNLHPTSTPCAVEALRFDRQPGDATESITTVHREGRETDDGSHSIVPGSSAALGCQGHDILWQETDESGGLSPFGHCFGSSLCFSMIKSLRVAETGTSPMLSL